MQLKIELPVAVTNIAGNAEEGSQIIQNKKQVHNHHKAQVKIDIADAKYDIINNYNYIRGKGSIPIIDYNRRNEGLQIDILVHKKGEALTLIECKYSTKPISTSIIPEIQRKIKFLKAPRHSTIERILISGGGVTADLQKSDYFHHMVGM